MSESRPFLHVLTGPTASGKTGIALRLAARRGREILCADSMSIYRRMDIGTAKPRPAERARVPHHGLDLVEPWQDFDTARYVAQADETIASAQVRGGSILVVGGTPLYLLALLRGFFDGPKAQPDLRAELRDREQRQPGALWSELARVDPEAALRIHRNDEKRLVRALEVFRVCGEPISALQRQFEQGPPRYPHRLVCLRRERAALKNSVRARTNRMFEQGLVDEVRSIRAAGGFSSTAASGIGYAQVLAFLDGQLGADELPYRVRSATHRLVRRQETWFRRFRGATRVDIEGLAEPDATRRVEEALFTPSVPA